MAPMSPRLASKGRTRTWGTGRQPTLQRRCDRAESAPGLEMRETGGTGTQCQLCPRNKNLPLSRKTRADRQPFSSVSVLLFDAQELEVKAGRQR